jgi:hypothetical protein
MPILHGAPHAGARLRFEGVGTRAGPRPSGGYGGANLTIPRLYDGRWSANCISQAAPNPASPLGGRGTRRSPRKPLRAGAPGATMARRLHGFFGLGLGPALLPGMAAD